MLVVQHDHKDLAFFERIGRIVVGDRHKTWVASHLSFLGGIFSLRRKLGQGNSSIEENPPV